MLFKQHILDAIAKGKVTLALRRWRRPSVSAGGRLRTPVGELAILAVDPITLADITVRDAKQAGFESLDTALADIQSQRKGRIYRIRFRLAGPDSRIALRNRVKLSATELRSILTRMARFDASGRYGRWTMKVLRLINQNPSLPARDLAELAKVEKAWLKVNVRKLKELGLTESLMPGYRLSPRGRAFLARVG